MKKYISLLLFVFLISYQNVSAHPGKTDVSGCHYCRTNCAKWGLDTGEYHCHNGNNQSNNNNRAPSSSPVIVKSSNNKLKQIMLNGKNVEVKEDIQFTTTENYIQIYVETEHAKANVNCPKTKDLSIGENKIPILVTAEDGSKKTYNVSVTREKVLSNNKNIEIKVNGKKLEFIGLKSKELVVDCDTERVNITYELEDSNSTAQILNNKKLKEGKNIIYVKVTSEDKTEEKYEIVVVREEKSKLNIILVPLFLAWIGGIIYIGYNIISKKKKTK